MKIGILTYYGVHNHGAVLQANGLKKVLEEMGHDVQFLSFERSYEYIPESQANKYKIGLKSIPFYLKYTFQKGLGNIVYNYKKGITLKSFRKLFVVTTAYDLFDGDAVVIGSDEVFSLEIGYNPMMFGHGIKAKNILSYAASFGPTTISEIKNKCKADQISDGLKDFSAIGVRDKNSQLIVKDLCNLYAKLTCDPVILYGYKKEMLDFVPNEPNYILVYAYDNRMNDPAEVSKVRTYADKNNLKVYSVGYYHKWCDKNINSSPTDLLGWIKNAKLVITDTFHGAVMSIICNTPMAVKLRGNANKLKYLLEEYNLSDRIMETFNDLECVCNQTIDFSAVNDRLQKNREESLLFLTQALEG